MGVYEEANTETGELGEVTVEANNGRYGPYLTKTGADGKSETRSLASEDEIFTVDVDKAKELFAQPKYGRGRGRGTAKPPLRELGPDPETGKNVTIKDGFYGATSPTAKRTGPCPSSTRPSPSSRPRRSACWPRSVPPARPSAGVARRRAPPRRRPPRRRAPRICHQEDGHREKDGRQEDHGQEDRREEDRRVESRRSRRDGGLAASHAAIAYTVGKGVDMTGLFILSKALTA